MIQMRFSFVIVTALAILGSDLFFTFGQSNPTPSVGNFIKKCIGSCNGMTKSKTTIEHPPTLKRADPHTICTLISTRSFDWLISDMGLWKVNLVKNDKDGKKIIKTENAQIRCTMGIENKPFRKFFISRLAKKIRKGETVKNRSYDIICGLSTVDTNLGSISFRIDDLNEVFVNYLLNYYSGEEAIDVFMQNESDSDFLNIFPIKEDYKSKKYTGVGKALLEFAQWFSVKCDRRGKVSLLPLDSARGFYETQGFISADLEMERIVPNVMTARLIALSDALNLGKRDIILATL
jgi:hypothetical protein